MNLAHTVTFYIDFPYSPPTNVIYSGNALQLLLIFAVKCHYTARRFKGKLQNHKTATLRKVDTASAFK